MIPRTAAACWYCKHDEHARCSAPDTCGCWPCHGAAMIDAVEAQIDALSLDVPGDAGLTRWPAGLEDALDLLHEQRAALLALIDGEAA